MINGRSGRQPDGTNGLKELGMKTDLSKIKERKKTVKMRERKENGGKKTKANNT